MQLQLFKYGAEHSEIRSILRDSISRIYSMGVIHDQLYQSGNLTHVDFAPYIQSLVQEIKDTFWTEESSLQLEINCDTISLNINQAVPCGLLLNEILTNAFKYAFSKKHEDPRIEITITKNNDNIDHQVSDNGTGLPESVNTSESESLGMQMIRTLINQLDASIDIDSGDGLTLSDKLSPAGDFRLQYLLDRGHMASIGILLN